MNEGEVLAAMRSQGQAAVESVESVVLETDGSFSVITAQEPGSRPTLADVAGYDGKSRETKTVIA